MLRLLIILISIIIFKYAGKVQPTKISAPGVANLTATPFMIVGILLGLFGWWGEYFGCTYTQSECSKVVQYGFVVGPTVGLILSLFVYKLFKKIILGQGGNLTLINSFRIRLVCVLLILISIASIVHLVLWL